jgi:hypothetical protein
MPSLITLDHITLVTLVSLNFQNQTWPFTWDCGLDQPVPGRAIFKQGAAGAYGHDQPDTYVSSLISGGSATAVDRWLPEAVEQAIV